jgi:DNA ligase D-like protein (predicted ligase)
VTLDPPAPGAAGELPLELPAELPLEPARLPDVVMPMFAGGASEPFDSREHLFEVRWDGLRALAFVEGGGYHLQDQSGRNITEMFPELGEISRRLTVDEAILDGVVVVSDTDGRPDFAALDRRMRLGSSQGVAAAAARQPAAYIVFDILYADARSVTSLSLLRRRRILREAIDEEGGRLCLSEAVAGEGVSFFAAARDVGIEAVIAKRKDSPYIPGGRSPSWLLVQDVARQDVVVLGYVPGTEGVAFESLLVGVFDGGEPVYAGAVGGGFDRRTERLLAEVLPGLRGGAEPVARAERVPGDVAWVRPELVISVKYSEWTPDGMLRFPIFVGMHPEVAPRACVRHTMMPPREAPAGLHRRGVRISLPQLPLPGMPEDAP